MKRLSILLIIALCLLLSACYTHKHVVGSGAQGNEIVTARQWYVAYGLAPINTVDSHAMAGGAKNYEVQTQQTFVDGVINLFTSTFTVTCQTVTVKK